MSCAANVGCWCNWSLAEGCITHLQAQCNAVASEWQLSDDIIVTHDQPIIIIVLQIKTPFSQSATQFMQLLQQCLCVNIRITIRYDLNQNILQQHLQVSQDIHHTVVLFKTQGGI